MFEKIDQASSGLTLNVDQRAALNGVFLHDRWFFREAGKRGWLEATVPGCNFTDLRNNGKIGDPFFGENEDRLQWIEEKDWEYKCLFKVEEEFLNSAETELVFEGLDTYCEVFLNKHKILDADNMFIAHRILCKKLLRGGDNELYVKFRSPISETRGIQKKLGTVYPAENDKSQQKLSVFTRKAPYHFGWDWGPKFVTSGIWKSVYLRPVHTGRISNVHIVQRWQNDVKVTLDFNIEIEVLKGFKGEIDIRSEQGVPKTSWVGTLKKGLNQVQLSLEIENPERWWPNGLGESYRYSFVVDLLNGTTVSSVEEKVGLRTIEVVNEPDDFGESFYLKVNGHPVFMKGANYIPGDSFLPQITKEKYEQLFEDVVRSNMNMLRVWGGGIYEDDYFYELADEYGVLIWQDFMFACTLYPGTDKFLGNVEKEAIFNIRRLRNHPCLALWCGNNEVDMGIEFWDWKNKFNYTDNEYEKLKQDYHRLFRKMLPQLVADLDPGRFYFPSSPIGFWEIESDDHRGDNHYWGVWHGEEDFDSYSKRVPRFMSEYGFQSFPLQPSVNKYILGKDQHIDSAAMQMHQKHPRGNRIINETILRYYKSPKDFESFLYLSQLVQADGLKIAFEAHRKAKPFCMGSLYWQLNDCWPVASWSGIDYYGKWKALHYQVMKSFSKYLVTAEMQNDNMSFYIVSDSLEEQNALLTVVWKDISGQTVREKQVALIVAPNASELVLSENISNRSDRVFFCTMSLTVNNKEVSRNIFYMQKMRDIELPPPDISYEVEEKNRMISLNLVSTTFVKSLYVDMEGMKGNFSDNFIDLVPYEPISIYYRLKEGEKVGDFSFLSVYDTYTGR